ncbi:hypothetical protein A7A76_08220 [Lysobacter enzymogenes]|nr:hypothetical protein [Lysobacter enzymogenes]
MWMKVVSSRPALIYVRIERLVRVIRSEKMSRGFCMTLYVKVDKGLLELFGERCWLFWRAPGVKRIKMNLCDMFLILIIQSFVNGSSNQLGVMMFLTPN